MEAASLMSPASWCSVVGGIVRTIRPTYAAVVKRSSVPMPRTMNPR